MVYGLWFMEKHITYNVQKNVLSECIARCKRRNLPKRITKSAKYFLLQMHYLSYKQFQRTTATNINLLQFNKDKNLPQSTVFSSCIHNLL